MAYISTERVKEIRQELKKALPEFKLSVTKRRYSAVVVSIMESPYDLFSMINTEDTNFGRKTWNEKPTDYVQINPFYFQERWVGKAKEVFQKIKDIAGEGSYNRNANDPYADYCDYTFYFDINIGKWNKPYKINPKLSERIKI